MDKNPSQDRRRWTFGLVFAGALALRLLLLDRFPLREYESRHAYQAWELWKNLPAQAGPRTLYLSVTEFLFSIFGSSAFTSRLWPALGGAVLVWIPYGFRKELGYTPALIWSIGLALDPGLLTGSRFAGSPVAAVPLILGGLLLLRERRTGWGIFVFGLAVITGPPFWLSVLVLWIGLACMHWFGPGDVLESIRVEFQGLQEQIKSREDRILVIGLPVVGLVLISTFRLTHLEGLTAWFSGLTAFLGGVTGEAGVPAAEMLAALAVYQPLAVLLGGMEAIRSWIRKDPRGQQLSLWFAAALLVVVIYPGRQVVDLIWALVPLYGLVGLSLARPFQKPAAEPVVSVVLGSFSLVLLSLMWLSFTGMIARADQTQAVLLQGIIILVALVLIGVAGAITAAEWNWQAARNGLLLGLGGGLLLYTLSAGIGSAYLRMNDPRELWVPGQGTVDVALLESTIQEVSLSVTGRRKSIRGAVYTEGSLLRWHFRDYPNLALYTRYREDLRPPVFIIDERSVKQISGDAYLGQDFLVATSPGWIGALPSPWKNWVAFREGLLEEHRYVLWVRRDILPEGDFLLAGDQIDQEEPEGLP